MQSYQYSATVGDLQIVDYYRILVNSYAAFSAGGVLGGTRVQPGSAVGGRRWWPACAGGESSRAGSPATPGSAGSRHCRPAPASPPDFPPATAPCGRLRRSTSAGTAF